MNNQSGSCDFQEDLISFLYGELGPTESNGFEAHLVRCPACASELKALIEVRGTLSVWKNEIIRSAPEGFVPLLNESESAAFRVARSTWRRIRDGLWDSSLRWSGAAAAFASLLVVVGVASESWRSSDSAQRQPVTRIGSLPVRSNFLIPLLDRNSDATLIADARSQSPVPPAALSEDGSPIVAGKRSAEKRSSRSRSHQRRMSFGEERQFLAELGVVGPQEEAAIPRLSDLLAENESND